MSEDEKLIQSLLISVGEHPLREGLLDTPKRVVKSWKELYKGYVRFGDELSLRR